MVAQPRPIVYENDAIRVFWRPTQCAHAGECWRGSREVFDPLGRPWVRVDAASPQEIAAIIDRCPSKALSYELK